MKINGLDVTYMYCKRSSAQISSAEMDLDTIKYESHDGDTIVGKRLKNKELDFKFLVKRYDGKSIRETFLNFTETMCGSGASDIFEFEEYPDHKFIGAVTKIEYNDINSSQMVLSVSIILNPVCYITNENYYTYEDLRNSNTKTIKF